MRFIPTDLDYKVSPYTGITRRHWIEAGKYLLNGIFSNLSSLDDPVLVPRTEMDITYPHKESTGSLRQIEEMAQKFEGLARSFFIAAPLIHDDPEIALNGISLREYYKTQILRACTKGDPNYVGSYEALQEITNHADPFRCFQQTVETCALVICLEMSREEIWETYTRKEKDCIAEFLLSFAHQNTVPQNWRLFNMLDMAFLKKEGYPIDADVMREHAQVILNYYAGDGWYRDGHCFDYYSCWAFNVYGPMWNLWYGYEHEPYIARRFEAYSHKLMESYPDFFDRDGFTNMWGRSNVYRNAATSAFDGNLILPEPSIRPGLARRISSGSLLQFFGRDDFLIQGVPTMGFYRQFPPLVQGYSCAESAYWMGKAFLCLHLPENHPFWTAVEENGTWETLGAREWKETLLNGPALCITNHNANGETILRSGKVVKHPDDQHGMWNYAKLSYNTKYPWESAPAKEVESMQYVLTDVTSSDIDRCNVTFWHGMRNQVLYRRQFFRYELGRENMWNQALNLADFPVEYGIIRADKLRLYRSPVRLTLGAYGFPDNGTEIFEKSCGQAKALILKGTDHMGNPKQLAMTIYDGWEALSYVQSTDTNPDSYHSIVVYGTATRTKLYGYEPFYLISQVITKESHDDFTEEELFPIEEIEYTDPEGKGGYGPVTLHLKNGLVRIIDFEQIEGSMML